MGTRGCVVVGTPEKWRGVYNHWDSYPSGLGKEVWAVVKERGIKEVADGILQYGDWREYLNEGVCEYCGKKAGQPHSILGKILIPTTKPMVAGLEIKIDDEVKKNIEETGYPDPEAKYHKHGRGPEDHLTDESSDPLFIEWVYVLDVEKNLIHVLSHISDGEDFKSGERRDVPIIKRADGFTDYGHCAYKHVLVRSVDVAGEEPDWDEIYNSEDYTEIKKPKMSKYQAISRMAKNNKEEPSNKKE